MNKEQLQFFYDEIMGLFGWDDGDEASGVDPLLWVKAEIGMKDKQLFAARQAILAGGIVEGQLRAELDKKNAAEICPVCHSELVSFCYSCAREATAHSKEGEA